MQGEAQMSYLDDDLEMGLSLMAEKIAKMFMEFQKETRHIVTSVDLNTDEYGNIGVTCRIELSSSVFVKNGSMDA
jgi:hypothetical protein